MGYEALDVFADMCRASFDKSGFKGVYAVVNNPSLPEKVILLKPETYMNLSGDSVQPLMAFYKIDIEGLVVVYDDMALEPGVIRLRPAGSSGSHKGMQNIIDRLGSDRIKRIRIGIGEPPHGGADFVLSKPRGEEKTRLDAAKEDAALAIRDYLLHDFAYAMNHHN